MKRSASLFVGLLIWQFTPGAGRATDVVFGPCNTTGRPWLGLGVQFDSESEDGALGNFQLDAAHWATVWNRLGYMRPSLVRSDSPTDDYVMSHLNSLHIPVILGCWGGSGIGTNDYLSSAYASQAAQTMNHLTHSVASGGLGCTNVAYWCGWNEPDNGGKSIANWETATANTVNCFSQQGVESAIGQMGPDTSGTGFNTALAGSSADRAMLAAYDWHRYPGAYSWETITRISAGNLEEPDLRGCLENILRSDPANKPVGLGEMGFYQYMYPQSGDNQPALDNSSIDARTGLPFNYEYGLDMADFAVQMARAGLSFGSCFDLDDAMHNKEWGLWNSNGGNPAGSDTHLRPTFYAWSLLTRYLPGSATAYPGQALIYCPPSPVSNVRVLAEQIGSGSGSHWTFVLINRGSAAQTLVVKVPGVGGNGAFNLYSYVNGSRTVDANGFPTPTSTRTAVLNNGLSVSIPGNALVLATSMDGSPVSGLPGGTPLQEGWYRLRPAGNPNAALSVQTNAPNPAAAIVESTYSATNAGQCWLIQSVGGGGYRLTPGTSSADCLDVSPGTTTLIQQGWWGGADERWTIQTNADGTCWLAPASNPGFYLDVHNGGTGDGTPVDVYLGNTGLAQKWYLIPLQTPYQSLAASGPVLTATCAETPAVGVAPLSVQFRSQAVGGSGANGAFDTTADHLGTITAQGENPPTETAADAFDGSTATKWLDFANAYPTTRSSWIQYQYADGLQYALSQYSVSSANDATTYPARNPRDWRLLASNDGGASWATVDARVEQSFSANFQKLVYDCANTNAYNLYRFQIDSVALPGAADAVQLSELQFGAPVYAYAWMFGDGAISTNQSPAHTYTSTGVFAVIETVSDGLVTVTNSMTVSTVPPTLNLSAAAGGITMSWPSWAAEYNLYVAANLTPPVEWTLITNAPVPLGETVSVTVPAAGQSRFFRLALPN